MNGQGYGLNFVSILWDDGQKSICGARQSIEIESPQFIADQPWLDFLDSLYPGLSVILSLAFIATAIKTTNDSLWRMVLDSYIQKSLPKADIGKILGLSGLMVLLVGIISPIFSGFIYSLYEGVPLLIGAVILNIIILIILIAKSIEPRVDVLELTFDLNHKL